MKIAKISIIALLVMFPLLMQAQTLDCSDFFKYRRVNPPYSYNSLSKSAVCLTGNKYEFILPLTQGKEYRLSFHASPVFNNKIDFKIVDQGTGNVVMNLPGESADGSNPKGSCVLGEYFDDKAGKNVHPFFDFYPQTTTSLKIIIDIKPLPQEEGSAGTFNNPVPRERGCISVMIIDKQAEDQGFKQN